MKAARLKFFNLGASTAFISDLTYPAANGTLKYFLTDSVGTTHSSDTVANPGTRHVAAVIGPARLVTDS